MQSAIMDLGHRPVFRFDRFACRRRWHGCQCGHIETTAQQLAASDRGISGTAAGLLGPARRDGAIPAAALNRLGTGGEIRQRRGGQRCGNGDWAGSFAPRGAGSHGSHGGLGGGGGGGGIHR